MCDRCFCIPLLLSCIRKVFPCLQNQAMLDKCIFRTPLKIIMQNPCVQVKWKPDGESSEQIQTQSAVYRIGLSVMFLVCCFLTVTLLQSNFCAVAWGHIQAPEQVLLMERGYCAAGTLENMSLPPLTSRASKLLPNFRHWPWGGGADLGAGGKQAGMRGNLRLMFLVSAPAEGAVGVVLLMRGGFCMVPEFHSVSSQEQKVWMLILRKNHRRVLTLEPLS